MIESSDLLAAVTTAASVLSLSLLCLLCLQCKRKSKIIHEENYIYNPQTFRHGGSMFAVTRSKTVTRAIMTTSPTVESFDDFSPADIGEQSYYKNVRDDDGQTENLEHTYVAPLPITVYENEQTERSTADASQMPGVYANVLSSSGNDDDDDYENSEFLNAVMEEQECESEPDYENENKEWTR